jgi:hypothetical protein
VELAALFQLTAGNAGGGPASVGTLDELFATGEWSTCPAYLRPTELPAQATLFDSDGLPLDGAYSNREPGTQLVHESLVPWVYLWCSSAQAVERMDSQAGFYQQSLQVLVRVRRDEDTASTPGGYGVTVAREFAQRQALNLCRATLYLLCRDLAATCRVLDNQGGFGVCYALQDLSPELTPNYGADGDTFADAIATIQVLQLRAEPANTGV